MKTQKQYDFSAKANECFMAIMRSDAPITKEEYAKLVKKNPNLWERFRKFFS